MGAKHLGILTGRGCPGLNAAIKAVYMAAKDHGWMRGASQDANVTAILRGWRGAVHMATIRPALPLTDDNTRAVDRTGGLPPLLAHATRPHQAEGPAARLQQRRAELRAVADRDDLYDVTTR